MITLPKEHKLTKTGPVSMSLVLPKEWVDKVKAALGKKEIFVHIFGEEFLVIEVKGLKIKNKKAQKILKECKEYFSVQKKVE